MKRYVAILGAVLLAGVLLSGAEARAQQTGTIRITAPAAGATVSGAVQLSVDIQGVTVKPAAEGDPNAFHYHALVDVDPTTVLQPGQPIPTGQGNIIHTADRTISIPDLAPGQHTVVVVLTRTDHVPLSPNVQDRVTFTVAAAQGAQPGQAAQAPAGQTPVAAPRVGTGGGIDADTNMSAAILLAVAAMALGAGGLMLRARRR
jgi:hypothetical protein